MTFNPQQILDSHVHFWAPDRLSYPWLDAHPELKRNLLPSQYRESTQGYRIRSIIVIQADVVQGQGELEAEFVSNLGEHESLIGASVAWAPLELGTGSFAVIDRLATLPRVRGIRRNLQFDPDPKLCIQPQFLEGAKYLASMKLTFDLCVDQRRLGSVVLFADRCPELRMVLDHCGKPTPSKKGFTEWAGIVSILGACPNVYCKLSGLIDQITCGETGYTEPERYILHILEAFGPERVMYGSDWPISNRFRLYGDWINELSRILEQQCIPDMDRIFYHNAKEFYFAKE